MWDINMLKINVWLAHQHDNLNVDEDEKEVNLLPLALKMDCSVHEVEGQDLHQLYLTRRRVFVHFRLKQVVKDWSLPPGTSGQRLLTSARNNRSMIDRFRLKLSLKPVIVIITSALNTLAKFLTSAHSIWHVLCPNEHVDSKLLACTWMMEHVTALDSCLLSMNGVDNMIFPTLQRKSLSCIPFLGIARPQS